MTKAPRRKKIPSLYGPKVKAVKRTSTRSVYKMVGPSRSISPYPSSESGFSFHPWDLRRCLRIWGRTFGTLPSLTSGAGTSHAK